MAHQLKPCPDCEQLVSRLAHACPSCGRPLSRAQSSPWARFAWGALKLTAFVAAIVVGCLLAIIGVGTRNALAGGGFR